VDGHNQTESVIFLSLGKNLEIMRFPIQGILPNVQAIQNQLAEQPVQTQWKVFPFLPSLPSLFTPFFLSLIPFLLLSHSLLSPLKQ
jgi:hypothetical protein